MMQIFCFILFLAEVIICLTIVLSLIKLIDKVNCACENVKCSRQSLKDNLKLSKDFFTDIKNVFKDTLDKYEQFKIACYYQTLKKVAYYIMILSLRGRARKILLSYEIIKDVCRKL